MTATTLERPLMQVIRDYQETDLGVAQILAQVFRDQSVDGVIVRQTGTDQFEFIYPKDSEQESRAEMIHRMRKGRVRV